MSLRWSTVKTEHITKACEMLLTEEGRRRTRGQSLFVSYRGHHLPVKDVVRLAYRIANSLPEDAVVKFASGEGTVRLLARLGFATARSPKNANQSAAS